MPLYQRTFAPEEMDEDLLVDEIEQAKKDVNLDPVEKNWAKRYGDLRRLEADLRRQNKELENKLEQANTQQISLPKTPEEVAAWARKYPDVAKIVETIALTKVQEARAEVSGLRKQVDADKEQNAKEKAQQELARLHPDFFTDIRNDPEFHKWLNSKSKRTQDALMENDTDAYAAAEVIDLYKLEMSNNSNRKSNPSTTREAASDVRARSQSVLPSQNSEYKFKESDIALMTSAQYERLEEEINQAIVDGKILYDVPRNK